MVGIITLARALILSNLIEERDDFESSAATRSPRWRSAPPPAS